MKHQLTILGTVVFAVLLHSQALALDDAPFQGRQMLQEWMARLTDAEGAHPTTALEDHSSAAAEFYRLVGYRPIWSGPDGLLPQGRILLQAITNAFMAGLDYRDYLLPDPGAALLDITNGADDFHSTEATDYIPLDVMLTDRLIRFAKHVVQGRVTPEQIYRSWLAERRSITRDIPHELAQAVKNDSLESFLESLHPRSKAYQRLLGALGRYEKIRRAGGWFPIDAGATLRHGDKGPRVAMLKHRLEITGDGFNGTPIDHDRFDDRTAAAVKQFQRRHGLTVDGLVGKATLAELNVPVAQRIRQLQLNMERWRWFPDSFGERYLMVNIPAYTLTLVHSGNAIHSMRVIVGKQDRQTPIMSDQMTYLEFNPYWNIPQGIAHKDILPKVKHDPFYLIRQGIRVFDTWDPDAQALDPTRIAWDELSARRFPYRLRQDPSHRNALGQVKFIFPNPLSIYIHDTPGKSLFKRRLRSFSSGCVRIEEPITLAHHLLKDQGWNHNQLDAVIAGEKHKSVILATPMPVHLVYFTAWTDENGTVNFRKDIYGRDARLFQALQHKAPDLIAHAPRPGNTNRLTLLTPDSRQNGRPPGDRRGLEKTVPKSASRFGSAL